MATLSQKLVISAQSALLFLGVNLGYTYRVTDQIFRGVTLFDNTTNCPSLLGKLVHTLVFLVLTFLSMGNPSVDTSIKLKHTLYGTLIFYSISSPAMYALVGSILGTRFADQNGCPTIYGVFVHSIVYFLVLLGFMFLPERN